MKNITKWGIIAAFIAFLVFDRKLAAEAFAVFLAVSLMVIAFGCMFSRLWSPRSWSMSLWSRFSRYRSL